jgi:hypothetical protein
MYTEPVPWPRQRDIEGFASLGKLITDNRKSDQLPSLAYGELGGVARYDAACEISGRYRAYSRTF